MSITLYPYQIKALDNLPSNVILSFDVGTGKTLCSLEHFNRHNPSGRLLIVCPASKKKTGDWDREINLYFNNNPPKFEVISYESMTKRYSEFIDPTLTIIVDECHFICNATAKRSKAFLKVAKSCKQWIGLSATPLPNAWRSAETYSILTGLCKNKTEFINRFLIIDRSRGFPLFLGYKDEVLLEKWWSSISKPLARTGDLILPSQNIGLSPQMDKKISSVYKRAHKERLYEVEGNDIMLDNASKLFTTLRQIPNPIRINALQSIVESTDEHIVIFYNFNVERESILEMLTRSFKNRKVYEQSGHVSNLPPRKKWDKLKPSVTIVQYQSGSAAIELTYTSVTVYVSPPLSWAMYQQSKGRNLRNGQNKTVLFYHIAVEGSLDKHIWKLVYQKKTFNDTLVNKMI